MTHRIRTITWSLALALVAGSAAAAQQEAAGDRAPAAFWRAYGDPALQQLVQETLRANHDIRMAAARMDAARATRRGGALDLVPAVTATAGYARQRFSSSAFPGGSGGVLPEQTQWDAGLLLSWEVDLFGRLRRSLRAQGELVSAAGEDVRDVQLLLTAQVASAYFTLRGAEDRLAVARRNAENQRRTLELTTQRLEAGRGMRLDTERARSQLSATLAIIPTLEAAIESARHRIGVLTGGISSAPLPPSSTLVLPEPFVVAHREPLVQRRPDVRGAERQLAARSSLVGVARADYMPRLAIGGGAGFTGSRFAALGDGGTPRYLVGPTVTWAAFDLGRVRAGVEAARAHESESRVAYERTLLAAREEIETSLTSYRKAHERLRLLEDAAAASERAAELARLRYTEGASDFLQVLDAERTVLERQDERARGRTEAAAALVLVYRALAGEVPSGSR